MTRYLRLMAIVLVISVFALSMASCAGKFALTNKLLNWNLSLNKWLGSFVLFVFIVVPVYGVCALIDWVILNVIEFYSGDNPVGANQTPRTDVAQFDGRRVSMTQYPGRGINLDLTTTEADGSTSVLVVRTTAEGMSARLVANGEESSITTRLDQDGDIERCVASNCQLIDRAEQADVLGQLDYADGTLLDIVQ